MTHTLKVEGADGSEDGTGRGTPIVPVLSVALRGRDGGATAELGGEQAGTLRASSGGGDKPYVLVPHVVAPPLTATNDPSRSPQSAEVTAQVEAVLRATYPEVAEVCGTLSDGAHHGGGLNGQDAHTGRIFPVVAHAVHENQRAEVTLSPVVGTLKCAGGKPGQGYPTVLAGNSYVPSAVPYDLFQVTAPLNRQSRDERSPCHTLARDNAAHAAVVIDAERQVCPTLTSRMQGSSGWAPYNEDAHLIPQASMFVRRLTPTECEALQGFSRNFTRIPWKGKPAEQCPDGPRYRALGNSMAVPVIRWIGVKIAERIALAASRRAH